MISGKSNFIDESIPDQVAPEVKGKLPGILIESKYFLECSYDEQPYRAKRVRQ